MEIKAEESSFEKVHIPEGIHHAEFVGVTDTPDGQYGPRVALDFVVHYSKTEKPAKIGRVLGKKLTPKAKLWEAFEALGGKPEVGKTFDTNALLGNFPTPFIKERIYSHSFSFIIHDFHFLCWPLLLMNDKKSLGFKIFQR